ncbi:MAG: CDF family Co(II)/Ni(II) efflux transporter DmeF [Rhizomicrobium sp.]
MTAPSAHDHARYTHGHHFLGQDHGRAEKRAALVTALTVIFMVVEITTGLIYGSMALLADGVHMLTHAGALGLAALAYALARRYNGAGYFSFGSGKFGDLSAFASAIVLGILGLGVAAESLWRFITPQQVAYGEALFIAVIGLLINIISAALLHTPHGHGHSHSHSHSHGHSHDHDDDHDHSHATDNNMRAAYIHVVTDALTSVLAIAALLAGYFFQIAWADALAGLVGAVMIGLWSVGLMRDSAKVLLDVEDDPALAHNIKEWLNRSFTVTISDFHLWRLGPGHRGLILSLIAASPLDADEIKHQLTLRYPGLSHITIETEVCPDCACHEV